MSVETSTKENQAVGIGIGAHPSVPWRMRELTVLPRLQLSVTFNDGRKGVIDFSKITTSEEPGIYAALRDIQVFASVRLELGAPVWPNGADIDPAWAYDELASKNNWTVPF